MRLEEIRFKPYADQKTGTAGLRKPTRDFMRPHYIEAFLQAAINVWRAKGNPLKTMVIGGDGRYPGREILPRVIKLLLGNGVEKIIVAGEDFVVSAPAISHIILKRGADGGFAFSASHNPAGPDGDFGIKIEVDGGQAPESFTSSLYQETLKNDTLKMAAISDEEALHAPEVEYIDSVADYAELMESMFDFAKIREWFAAGHTFRFDAMHASTGKYARRIFVEKLGARPEWILRGETLPDFGGLHPEPNPTHAKELYDFMLAGGADFAAACDGDGDRDMVLGDGIFIYPSDSLAAMVKYHKLVPYFAKAFHGVARSYPTSSAVDKVAEKMGVPLYKTPTGWKFFVSLMDAGRISLCGEESFGQGGDYIREKDGIFAVLFWLSILAETGKSAKEIMHELWREYGRTFYSQYSYEGVDKEGADELLPYISEADLKGKRFGDHTIVSRSVFDYTDPITGEESRGMGVEIFTDTKIRIFFRLSGTGTVGATLRFYIEKYEPDERFFDMKGQEYLRDIYPLVEEIFRLKEVFGPDIMRSGVN